jgi:cytochrome P450
MSSAPLPSRNLVSPENLLNPIPLYEELRESDPVHWSEELHAWVLTRHDDVSACFRDSRFSANRLKMFEMQAGALGADLLKDYMAVASRQMLMKDGAEHIRMRRQTMAAFTPHALASWRPTIYRIIEDLVARVQPKGHMDLVEDLSYQFPPLVLAEVVGVPAEDLERFRAWSVPLADFAGPGLGIDLVATARRANQATKELFEYLVAHVEKLRDNPGQDALSQILTSHRGHIEPMDAGDLAVTSSLLLTAGHLTTTDQLSNGLYDLLRHPEQLRLLREDANLLPSAVDEMMRYSPAVPFFHRIVAEDLQLRDKSLRKGDLVFLGMAAANRDPAVFADPNRFDITRGHLHSRHVSFGHGPHHCLGAGLARRELEIALEVLLRQLPGLQLDEQKAPELKYHSLIFRGFTRLPVRWSIEG